MVQEVIYLCKFLSNLGIPRKAPTPVLADDETCIAWSEGSVGGSERAKRDDLRRFCVLTFCMRLALLVIWGAAKWVANSMQPTSLPRPPHLMISESTRISSCVVASWGTSVLSARCLSPTQTPSQEVKNGPVVDSTVVQVKSPTSTAWEVS